jgi:hypothetical protein
VISVYRVIQGTELTLDLITIKVRPDRFSYSFCYNCGLLYSVNLFLNYA